MNVPFCKILALVDYSELSLHAAEEAALIASRFDSELQLLHILPEHRLSGLVSAETPLRVTSMKHEQEYFAKIEKLKRIHSKFEKQYKVSFTCFENRGHFIDVVKRHVSDFSVDLVVLGAKKRNWLKKLFVESKVRSVIRAVHCDVLCINPYSSAERLKRIVLPVGKIIPKKKIRIAYELAKKFAARIYLIGLNNAGKGLNHPGLDTLIASYRYLNCLTNTPVECTTVRGKSVADATIHFAESIEADLILIDEGVESNLKKHLWSENIVNHSLVPVLSVQSTNERVIDRYKA